MPKARGSRRRRRRGGGIWEGGVPLPIQLCMLSYHEQRRFPLSYCQLYFRTMCKYSFRYTWLVIWGLFIVNISGNFLLYKLQYNPSSTKSWNAALGRATCCASCKQRTDNMQRIQSRNGWHWDAPSPVASVDINSVVNDVYAMSPVPYTTDVISSNQYRHAGRYLSLQRLLQKLYIAGFVQLY